MSSASDTTDYDIVVTHLEDTFVIKDTTLNWFKPYLTERWQSVVVNGVRFSDYLLNCGVSQGSVLGPVLVTMCIKWQ